MDRRLRFRAFFLRILLVALCPCCAAGQQEPCTHISIRIVDCRTGQRVKHVRMSVYTNKADAYSRSSSNKLHLNPPSFRIESDSRGVATLEIGKVTPDVVFLVEKHNFWPTELNVSAILDHGGANSAGACSGQHATVPGLSPGEFVYWIYKPTFRERLEQPLEWLIPGI
jgi:hypothetical protein